jgi:UDP-GlcNAc3NAcA epimerase
MKVLSVVGARPQFIKAAVLSPEFAAIGIKEVLVHTGQHYDYNMSAIFFEGLKLKQPDYYLGVGSASHAAQTAAMMVGLEPVLAAVRIGLWSTVTPTPPWRDPW